MTAVLAPTARCAASANSWAWESDDPDAQTYAKAGCARCPLVARCLNDALRFGDGGVRGGTTEAERVAMGRPTREADVRHNRARYVSGKCRCPRCSEANSRYVRLWRAQRGPVTKRASMFVELPGGQLALRMGDR